MHSSCLDSWLEDKCSGFESALAHYPLSNGLFCVFWFSNLSSGADGSEEEFALLQ